MTNIPEAEKILPFPSGEAARPNLHPEVRNAGIASIHSEEVLDRTLGLAQQAGAPVHPAAESISPVSEPQVAEKIKLPSDDSQTWEQAFQALQAEKQEQPDTKKAHEETTNITDFQKVREELDKERGQNAA